MASKCCILAGLIALVAPLTAGAGELLSPEQASRAGLVQSWQQQLRLINGAASIVDIQLHVERERKRQLVEVTQQVDGESHVLLRIPVDQLDELGQPIGLDEARRRAAMEVRRFARRGIEATVSETSVPEIRLYTLGTDGAVEARDAETGHLLWVNRYGDRRLPYGSLGVDDRFVTFVNGSTLVQLSAEDGRLEGVTRTQATPAFGASIVGQYAMVPTLRGGIEGHPLDDLDSYPFIETVAGRALAEPVSAPGSTLAAWPTDRQFVYVMDMQGTPSVLFRLNTDGSVRSPAVAARGQTGDRFFFASDSGQVYGLLATRSGQVLWRQSLGQPVYSPVFLGADRLLVTSVYGSLFCLDITNGAHAWSSPVRQVDDVLCIAGNKVFVRTSAHHLAAVDVATGARVLALSDVTTQHYLVNDKTDRLYLLSDGGAMQCLRPVNAELPNLLVPIEAPPAQPDAAEPPTQPSDSQPDGPFDASGQNPFAAPSDGQTPAVDPFAVPAGEPADDPFGGANPFGDNPF